MRQTEAALSLRALTAARARLDRARVDARHLVASVPDILTRVPIDLDAVRIARATYTTWITLPEDDLAMAEHLQACHADLTTPLT